MCGHTRTLIETFENDHDGRLQLVLLALEIKIEGRGKGDSEPVLPRGIKLRATEPIEMRRHATNPQPKIFVILKNMYTKIESLSISKNVK